MAISTSKHLQQCQFFSSALRKFPPSSSASFKFSFPTSNHTLKSNFSQFSKFNEHNSQLDKEQELSKEIRNGEIVDEIDSGVSSVGSKVDRKVVENNLSSVVEKNRRLRREIDSGILSGSKDKKFAKNVVGMRGIKGARKNVDIIHKKSEISQVKFKENVPNMRGAERVSKKMDGISKKGESIQVKSAERGLKMEGVKRVSKKMDGTSKKGESSQLNFAGIVPKMEGIERVTKKMDDISKKGEGGGHAGARVGAEKKEKGSKKFKNNSPEAMLKVGLDSCSKRGDVMGGIGLYDMAKREGIKIGQYHYAVLLYLCSSAATGIIQSAKSGKGSRSLSIVDSSHKEDLDEVGKMGKKNSENVSGNFEEKEKDLNKLFNDYRELSGQGQSQTLDGLVRLMVSDVEYAKDTGESDGIKVSEEMKNYAIKRGFEIYKEMVSEKVPMNEASLTSLARMAMSMGNGEMAFDMVKKMKELGINPRLRSYGPALSVFCNNGDIEKAFAVEEHMLKHDVNPEAPELEALMKASVEASKSDKVYYLLHKLRKNVRKVLPTTADLIEKWFLSNTAARVGKRKWDPNVILKAVEDGGGGWHGKGWLGKGKWKVVRTNVGEDGFCKGCAEKLVTIDLDPAETENFAESVARIAKERDKNSSFQKFQKWLDYHGPFEAVVDAANVGLFNTRTFSPSKVDLVADGIRQMLPSKKWPLIVLHNRRITGDNMDQGVNKTLIAKWKIANALYATPTGSNDDWYWLYAAIKSKCLLVTNDEMRDHLFQLLGNDFFPKWKERHQVRFTRCVPDLEFQMPPPCSVVIQESKIGHWHIPIVSEKDTEGERPWLCITRSQTDEK